MGGGGPKNGSSKTLVEDNKSKTYTIKSVVQWSDKSKTIKELNRDKLSRSRRLRPAGGHTEPEHRKA